MNPNWEYNERNTVVVFGDFSERKNSEAGARFPGKLESVADETPLILVGPSGKGTGAGGLTWGSTTSGYDAGPTLVGAKLNRAGDHEGGVQAMDRFGYLPNDGSRCAVTQTSDCASSLRAAFSPDCVTGLRPGMFEDFFRFPAQGPRGGTIMLNKVGVDYQVAGDLAHPRSLRSRKAENHKDGIYYDDCYREDNDNYIDIVLIGDDAAAQNIIAVEIPSLQGGYRASYNPGRLHPSCRAQCPEQLMFDEVVGKPVGRVCEVLVAEHFLGEGAYGLRVCFRRGHAHPRAPGRLSARSPTKPSGVIAASYPAEMSSSTWSTVRLRPRSAAAV